MRRTTSVGLAVLAGTIAFMASASGQTDGEATPIYGVKLPAGYRDWPLMSVATVGAPVSDSPAWPGSRPPPRRTTELSARRRKTLGVCAIRRWQAGR